MPSAPLRPCLGCHVPTKGSRCQKCARTVERQRGSASARGYDAKWDRHRRAFINKLIEQHIVPVCGARLPGAPVTQDSLCAQEGLLTGDHLDTDHIEPHSGQDDPRFWDERNLQLLCHTRCHPRKTATKDGGFGHAPKATEDVAVYSDVWK